MIERALGANEALEQAKQVKSDAARLLGVDRNRSKLSLPQSIIRQFVAPWAAESDAKIQYCCNGSNQCHRTLGPSRDKAARQARFIFHDTYASLRVNADEWAN